MIYSEKCIQTSKIFLVLLMYMKSYSHCNRKVALYLITTQLKGIVNELDFYQSLVLDLNVLQWYSDELTVGVQSDLIQIKYCIYHICIHTQPLNKDTDDGCEKMKLVSAKIESRIRIRY